VEAKKDLNYAYEANQTGYVDKASYVDNSTFDYRKFRTEKNEADSNSTSAGKVSSSATFWAAVSPRL
jgi:hypothetical protein